MPVNSQKNRASSESLYKNNRTQVSMGYLTIRPVARKDYGSIAHEAKPNGLLLLYNNSEDARFFCGFTGTINNSNKVIIEKWSIK